MSGNKIDFGSENNVKNSLLKELIVNGFIDFKSEYKQSIQRPKNLGGTKPDIILKDKNANVSIIEVKFQPAKNIAAIRFERSIIDLLYLANEQYHNNSEGYLLFIDVDKTKYLDEKNIISTLYPLIQFNIKKSVDWLPCNDGKSLFVLFKVEYSKSIYKTKQDNYNKIRNFQKRCWSDYKNELGLNNNYNYLFGNPVKVHIPIYTTTNGLLIIGAYPTAHFQAIKNKKGRILSDVPVEDHLYPFSNECYFDGSRVRTVKSGEELENLFLKPLSLKRSDCWITDLVKVFLFKEGHAKKYLDLGLKDFKANRDQFMVYAERSLRLLIDEINLANPKAILVLGEEVTSVVLGIPKSLATSKMNGVPIDKAFGNKAYPVFASPHPGILMRNSERAEHWKQVLADKILPAIQGHL